MRVRATALIDAATHVVLRPPVAEHSSWTLVLDGGLRGGEIVLMFADPADARRVVAALVDALPRGDQ
jgi:2-keto-3-deoxy-L-rhamnonate aldolase RhmA